MLKRIVSTYILLSFAYLSFLVQAIPQGLQTGLQTPNNQFINQTFNQTDVSPLTQLGNEYHNSIELLQNRFRIDYEVAEITMIFFREFGSAPVILVRPDGSKIFQSSANDERVVWFDSTTYDMVSIKNPMPGPWQAIGQITPKNRVMVISELAIHAEPLPNIIFSGEILKQTAYLTNNGLPIDYAVFRDVVELTISLSSTNNNAFNNFGAGDEIVASFKDNGKGMDERPLDGIFTGQFNLAIAGGEWIPTFNVSTPMFNREQVDQNIMLLANPIKIEAVLDGGGGGYHKLKVDAQREYVDMSTLLIDGKVQFPNGDVQNFSISDMSADVREHMIVNSEYGVYIIKLTAYGSTTEGREFILDIPEYSFLSERSEQDVMPLESGIVKPVIKVTAVDDEIDVNDETDINDENDEFENENENEIAMQENTIFEKVMPLDKDKMSTSTLVSIIVGINLFILIVGGSLIWWLTLDKKPNFKLMKKFKMITDKKQTVEKSADKTPVKKAEKKPGFFEKIFKRKSGKTTTQNATLKNDKTE